MFEKSLVDLVRGIRNNKGNEQKFINQCIAEIKIELKGKDQALKASALQKLLYLKMLNYDISFAHFNAIEIMSSTKFSQKRVGYLASTITFNSGSEFVLLTTNLFKKEFQSSNHYDIGLALNGIVTYCNQDLAMDIVSDVVGLLGHTKPYIRKKAALCLYKVFLQYPDALRPAFPKLKEKLEDPDFSVVSCAVNVIFELAKRNPKNYLALAPIFFKILTESNNNWMLIKVVKLFGILAPLEPRLAKKLATPLMTIINTTTAMSLLYECIQTSALGLHEYAPLIRLCVDKLRIFIEDTDQNLKYLGLVGLGNVMKNHPKMVSDYASHVLACLDDDDITIRLRALDLLVGMATKKNLPDIVGRIMQYTNQADDADKDELVSKMIELCRSDDYQLIASFQWYIQLLCDLSLTASATHGSIISDQLIDVMLRVRSVQPFGAKSLAKLLADPRFYDTSRYEKSAAKCILRSAAWLVGEYAQFIDNPPQLLELLLHSRVHRFPETVQTSFINAAFKLVVKQLNKSANQDNLLEQSASSLEAGTRVSEGALLSLIGILDSKILLFTRSCHVEVQERACFVKNVCELLFSESGQDCARELAYAYTEELNPVAPKAQAKVPLPEGLDLNSWINEPEPDGMEILGDVDDNSSLNKESSPLSEVPTGIEVQKSSRKGNDPFYIKSSPKGTIDIDNIPIQTLTLEDVGERITEYSNQGGKGASQGDLLISSIFGQTKSTKKTSSTTKKSRKGRKSQDSDEEPVFVSTKIEMPEGASLSDEEKVEDVVQSKAEMPDIDLFTPLGANEVLPSLSAYGSKKAAPSKSKKQPVTEEMRPTKAHKADKKDSESKSNAKKSTSTDFSNTNLLSGMPETKKTSSKATQGSRQETVKFQPTSDDMFDIFDSPKKPSSSVTEKVKGKRSSTQKAPAPQSLIDLDDVFSAQSTGLSKKNIPITSSEYTSKHHFYFFHSREFPFSFQCSQYGGLLFSRAFY
eukprot:TRINITY_DN7268_c0_g2_i1.p1 TRINITY_DN7268_c0_g2~~TRINITY_DN7268_c0_g2_i1.p1  ORF type:complete len:978 (+),score=193.82 TRINITY_DN7268_c0_g2_i1:49-2982(+)